MVGEGWIWIILVLWTLMTWSRVRVWGSEVAVWEDAVTHAPCVIRPHLQLAFAAARDGRSDVAEAAWQDAERLFRGAVCR